MKWYFTRLEGGEVGHLKWLLIVGVGGLIEAGRVHNKKEWGHFILLV